MYEFAERFMTDMDVFVITIILGGIGAAILTLFISLAIDEWRRNK